MVITVCENPLCSKHLNAPQLGNKLPRKRKLPTAAEADAYLAKAIKEF